MIVKVVPMDENPLRKKIQDFLDSAGWSQSELARRIGVSSRTVSAFMTGRTSSMREQTVNKIEELINLHFQSFFNDLESLSYPELPPDNGERFFPVMSFSFKAKIFGVWTKMTFEPQGRPLPIEYIIKGLKQIDPSIEFEDS